MAAQSKSKKATEAPAEVEEAAAASDARANEALAADNPEAAAKTPAVKIPRDDELTTVEFRGVIFSFPSSRADWPTRAMQAFQNRRNADGVELLFGPQQWDLLNTVAPKMSDFWEFFPKFAQAAGFITADGDGD